MSRQLGNFAEPGDAITVGRLKLGEFGYIACHNIAVKGNQAFVDFDVPILRWMGDEAIRVERVQGGLHITFLGFAEHRWMTSEPAIAALKVIKISVGKKTHTQWTDKVRYTSIATMPVGSRRYVRRSDIQGRWDEWSVFPSSPVAVRQQADTRPVRRLTATEYVFEPIQDKGWFTLRVISD